MATALAAAPAAGLLVLAGCASPFQRQTAEELRSSLQRSLEREIEPDAAYPEPRELSRDERSLGFSDERLGELREMAGPGAYAETQLPMGDDLLGRPQDAVVIDLDGAVASSVQHNLTVQRARFTPAIAQQRLIAADAVFDWALFADFTWQVEDTPTLAPSFNGVPVGSAVNQSQSVAFETGVRRQLTTGGEFSIAASERYLDEESPAASFTPDPSHNTALTASLTQPLLRGFGSRVNLAEVRLAENARARQVFDLERTLIDTVTDVEQAYWDLVGAYRTLQVQQRLLERGIRVRDVLEKRLEFDARPAEFSDAVARVETRRANVITAVNDLRRASDRLKVLINDPAIPVGGEALLVPAGEIPQTPIAFSLLDAMTTALRNRPDVEQAVLDIDDTEIRLIVADNGLLPRLDLSLQASVEGLDEGLDDAIEETAEGDFLSWLLGLAFERPIGNRGPEAEFTRARLERLQALTGYRRVVQGIILDVKQALRQLDTNYRLIEQTRIARLAATENLRTLEVQKQTIRGLTPEFLDLELSRQEALAQAELREIGALTDYNLALAQYYAATGTTLQIRGIVVEPPTAQQLIDAGPRAPRR